MRRIRFLRIVLPLLLVGLVVAIGLTAKSRPRRALTPATPSTDDGARMEGFRFSDLVGGRRRLLIEARVGHVDGQGAFEVEDVRRAEVDREGQTPLVLSASKGQGSGSQGRRTVRLEGGVTVHDDDLGMTLEIPTVEVDQVAGVMRSIGEVKLSGPRWNGAASAIIHSLRGDPTLIFTLVADGLEGEHLEAQKATVDSGSRTLTLEGAVSARQGGMEIDAPRVVLVQRPGSNRIESVKAGPGVAGRAAEIGGGAGRFAAQDLDAVWGPDGTLTGFTLSGRARIEHARGVLVADRIEASKDTAGTDMRLAAAGQVVASGAFSRGPGRLSCDKLTATLAKDGTLREGTASGDVRFDGDGTAGEAAEAHYQSQGADGSVTLHSGPSQRARIANGRMRVAADTIESDLRASRFEAKGRVEATLLPDATSRRSTPMFESGDAVHFVSASLVSEGNGSALVFRGDVRGWQGDKNLAATVVEMRQAGETLDASGGVTTRLPVASGRTATEGDYLQVAAERLAYRGTAHTASYDGNVRVRQAEGWLEAPHLEALLGEGGHGIRTAQATGGVRFEYRSREASGATSTADGQGDRAVYDALARVVRLLGDKGPATVVASGPNTGTTTGRVLRYELDSGALEVESGERDRATISTPKQ